jgi:transcriptional regulator with XRE-family HTH domain
MPKELDHLLIAFGEQLKEFRKQKGISQEDFALDAGLDRTYISGLECGKRNPTLKSLCRVAQALEMEPSELIKNIHQLAREQGGENE